MKDSGISVGSGARGGQFNRERSFRTSNECNLSVLKRVREAIPSFKIQYSLFDILRFAVQPGCQSGQFNHQKTVPFWRSFTRFSV
jgi:hypothetical protein